MGVLDVAGFMEAWFQALMQKVSEDFDLNYYKLFSCFIVFQNWRGKARMKSVVKFEQVVNILVQNRAPPAVSQHRQY